MEQVGRLLVVMGAVIAITGLVLMLGPKLPLNFQYQRGNFTFYFPLGISILLSVLLTLIFTILNRR
jgi:uncharacterized integral membrane protein